VLVACVARAEELVTPPLGAQARVLLCGPSPRSEVSVFTWDATDEHVVLRQSAGAIVGPKPARAQGTSKPEAGCRLGLPTPTEDWHLAPVTEWTRGADGAWVDAQGAAATVNCTNVKVRAVENATALVPNPRSGCGDSQMLMLVGGPRVEVGATRCVLKSKRGTFTLTFGVERIHSDNDCGGGGDWRVTR
jgi:hypothetical protein